MEILPEPTTEQKLKKVAELIEAAKQGIDVYHADPRDTSIEAVVTANRIRRAQGARALNIVQSGL